MNDTVNEITTNTGYILLGKRAFMEGLSDSPPYAGMEGELWMAGWYKAAKEAAENATTEKVISIELCIKNDFGAMQFQVRKNDGIDPVVVSISGSKDKIKTTIREILVREELL